MNIMARGSERFAAALRDAKTGLGRYPRIALRSIRGYFRSFPPGRMQLVLPPGRMQLVLPSGRTELVLRSWQRMEPPLTSRFIHAIAGMSRPTQFTVCAAGTLFYARGQPFSGCDGERIPGRRAVSSLADCWTGSLDLSVETPGLRATGLELSVRTPGLRRRGRREALIQLARISESRPGGIRLRWSSALAG